MIDKVQALRAKQAHRCVQTSQTDDLWWVKQCVIDLWLENRISDDEHSKAFRSLYHG